MTAPARRSTYDGDSIIALEGLEPVRKRPGMYIGTAGKTGFHHLLWEIVDNSVDEGMNGYADRIEVTLHADGSASVADNGRGIPVDPRKEPQYKGMSTVEMIFTVLHAGGKFDGENYDHSGGLHGVGSSVVTALSEWVTVEVRRNGTTHRVKFETVTKKVGGKTKYVPGVIAEPLKSSGKIPKALTGSTVRFLPDTRPEASPLTYSGFDFELVSRRLRQSAFLCPGLTFVLRDERHGDPIEVTYVYPNGLLDFAEELAVERLADTGHEGERDLLLPSNPIVVSGRDEKTDTVYEMVFRWFPDTYYRVNSFANGIETGHGGKHVKGYESVLTGIMNRYARQEHIGLLGEKEPNLEAIDVRAGLGMIVAVKVRDPHFVGQTKDELSNDDVATTIRYGFTSGFGDYLAEHPVEAKAIVSKCVEEMRRRLKVAAFAEAERSKGEKRGLSARSLPLPAKLVDAEAKDRSTTELFIVEGDSAAGPAKKIRSTQTQAVLPIRGKGLNIERALEKKGGEENVQANAEIQGILASLGAGSLDLFDLSAMRYGKVVILTDADDDGAHIQLLLMTAFYRLAKPLVDAGRLYVARPPLFTTELGGKKVFAADNEAREAIEAKHPRSTIEWTRFKGLGEMNANELGPTCIDPATRNLVRVVVEDDSITDGTITALMGDDAEPKWELLSTARVVAEEIL